MTKESLRKRLHDAMRGISNLNPHHLEDIVEQQKVLFPVANMLRPLEKIYIEQQSEKEAKEREQ